MIETTIYKCEYCGAEFDDEHEAHCHEWVCRYNDVKKRKGSNLGFYKEDGSEIKFEAQHLYNELDDMTAFTVGNNDDIKFVIELFEWLCYGNPFYDTADGKSPNYYGLWWFDPEQYYGVWVQVDEEIEKWTNIKNKFVNNA